MEQEMFIILSVFFLFILTGVFGAIGIYSILHQKRKRAIWSFIIGFIMILIYLIIMFSIGLVSL